MSLKRTRLSSDEVIRSKRQNVADERSLGLLTPPATPLKECSFSSITRRSGNSNRGRSTLTNKLLSSVKKPAAKVLTIEEQESIKENVEPDTKELALIQEIESLDTKYNIKPLESCVNKESIYTQAKKLFSKRVEVSGSDDKSNFCLAGREQEFRAIERFLMDNITNNASDFLYISGPPGCGKTQQCSYVLDYVMKQSRSKNNSRYQVMCGPKVQNITITKINCMRILHLNQIFDEFLKSFGIDHKSIRTYPSYLDLEEKTSAKELFIKVLNDRRFSDNNVILLDELDAVLKNSKNLAEQQLLFDFFSLARQNATKKGSKLILVGIANSLNLIDKIGPRLKLHGLRTNTIQFLPYSTVQIVDIVKKKLSSLDPSSPELPVINPSALQLCAKKTASNTGDLRKVFDILYQAIEMVESTTKKQYMAHEEKKLSDFYNLTATNAPKVSLTHIARVCANSLNGVSSANRLKQINLYQCIVLISLAKLEQQINEKLLTDNSRKQTSIIETAPNFLGNPSASQSFILRKHSVSLKPTYPTNAGPVITVTKLYTHYKTLTKKNNLIPTVLTRTEFTDILGTLHTIGLVNIINKTKDLNINSQTALSCCGISLMDLNKFIDGKFEILKSLLKA